MNLYDRNLAMLDKDVLSLCNLEGTYTAGELRNSVLRYESMLGPLNLEGKRIALIVPVIKEYIPLFLAANKLKATVAPLSYQLRREDLSDILEFLDPHIVFTVNEFSGFTFPEVITKWALGRETETLVFTSDNCTNWEVETFPGCSKNLQSDSGGFICFTSGSTGAPKGMVFKDDVMDYVYNRVLEAMNLKSTDNVFVYASPSTQYGVASMNSILKAGATLVVADEFDLLNMINTMQKAKCNKVTTTPSIFKSLYNFASRLNPEVLNRLELVCVIGEKIPTNFRSHFPLLKNCTFVSHYGSSESGSLANAYINEDTEELIFRMADPVEFKTVEGELFVKTAGLFTEYYKNPILTQGAFEKGWFMMGDLVEFLDEKNFKIVGRKKDVIKKGGQQVISGEVEQILSNIVGVKSVAVVGAPHDVYGEQIVAYIIAEGLTSKDIRTYCTGKYASYKIPDQIIFTDEFPLTNGKVDKIKLKSRLGRG